MLDHVLVPLDASDFSERALAYLPSLTGPGSRVTLLMIVTPPDLTFGSVYPLPSHMESPLPGNEEGLSLTLRRQADDYLHHVSKRLSRLDLKVSTQAQIGDPANGIVEVAESLKVDAIVMTTHGRSGLSRWLMGSVTQNVLSASPCPVFVIPSKHQAGG